MHFGRRCTMLVIINRRMFTLFAWLVEHSLVHWYQQCLTLHHVPKCMNCHKVIGVITGRAHCFHDYIYLICPCYFCEILALCMLYITYIYLCLFNIYIHIHTFIYKSYANAVKENIGIIDLKVQHLRKTSKTNIQEEPPTLLKKLQLLHPAYT